MEWRGILRRGDRSAAILHRSHTARSGGGVPFDSGAGNHFKNADAGARAIIGRARAESRSYFAGEKFCPGTRFGLQVTHEAGYPIIRQWQRLLADRTAYRPGPD